MPLMKKYVKEEHIIQIWNKGEFVIPDEPLGLEEVYELYPKAFITTPVLYTEIWQKGAERLNEYDRIARMVLAITYSGGPGQGRKGMRFQAMIGKPTIAVAQDAKSGTLVIARNKINLFHHKRVKAAFELERLKERYHLLDNDYAHAEMCLVNYFYNNDFRMVDDMMGVSKPCCRACADRLEALGIDYSFWHDQPVGEGWVPCTPEKKWWKGEGVAKKTYDNSGKDKKDAPPDKASKTPQRFAESKTPMVHRKANASGNSATGISSKRETTDVDPSKLLKSTPAKKPGQ